jgi:hypothetical protein
MDKGGGEGVAGSHRIRDTNLVSLRFHVMATHP